MTPIIQQAMANVLTPTVSSTYVPPGRTVLGSTTIEVGSVFSGWCAFCKLANGNAFAAWARSATIPDATTSIVGSSSSNGGTSWSGAASVLAAPTGGHSTCLPTGLTVLSDNSVVLLIVQDNFGYAMRSTNNGSTWSAPAAVNNAFGQIPISSSAAIQLGNGNLLQALYGQDTAGSSVPTYIRISKSTDSGSTWTDTGVNIAAATGFSFAEPWLCPLDDGRILMTIRHMPNGNGTTNQQLWTAFSSDNGATWTTPTLAFTAAGASPAVIQTPELDVWIVSRDNTPSYSEPVVYYSTDRGATWSQSFPLAPATRGYFYGQWAYIGAAGADGSLALVTGQVDANGTDTDAVFYKFTKKH